MIVFIGSKYLLKTPDQNRIINYKRRLFLNRKLTNKKI